MCAHVGIMRATTPKLCTPEIPKLCTGFAQYYYDAFSFMTWLNLYDICHKATAYAIDDGKTDKTFKFC